MCDYSLHTQKTRDARIIADDENQTTNLGYQRLVDERPMTVVKFTRTNEEALFSHHDAIVWPDGYTVLLNDLEPGQRARVLQLPSVVVQVAEDKGATREHDPVREAIDFLASTPGVKVDLLAD